MANKTIRAISSTGQEEEEREGKHTHPSGTAGGLVVTYEHWRGDSVVRIYDWHNIQAN